MNQTAILDATWIMPAFLATGLAKSTCTIQAPVAAADGEPLIGTLGVSDGNYTTALQIDGATVPSIIAAACMDAPEGLGGGIAANEIKTPGSTSSIEIRHVLLGGHYPQLAQISNWGGIGWRATITTNPPAGSPYSTVYDIYAAESDSQSIMTHLKLKRESI